MPPTRPCADTRAGSVLTERILHAFYAVYNELGAGFLESVYQQAMVIALTELDIGVVAEASIGVSFRGRSVGTFRADLVVDDAVIVELKAGRALEPAHEAQLLNLLRASRYELGMLLHFGPKPQFRRLVFSNDRKGPQISADVGDSGNRR